MHQIEQRKSADRVTAECENRKKKKMKLQVHTAKTAKWTVGVHEFLFGYEEIRDALDGSLPHIAKRNMDRHKDIYKDSHSTLPPMIDESVLVVVESTALLTTINKSIIITITITCLCVW